MCECEDMGECKYSPITIYFEKNNKKYLTVPLYPFYIFIATGDIYAFSTYRVTVVGSLLSLSFSPSRSVDVQRLGQWDEPEAVGGSQRGQSGRVRRSELVHAAGLHPGWRAAAGESRDLNENSSNLFKLYKLKSGYK